MTTPAPTPAPTPTRPAAAAADCYIRSVREQQRLRFEPEFHAAVLQRDAYAGDDPRRHRALQARVEELHGAMYGLHEGHLRVPAVVADLLGLRWSDLWDWPDDADRPCITARTADALLTALRLPNEVRLLDARLAALDRAALAAMNHGVNDFYATVDNWRDHFRQGCADVLAFLQTAVDLDERIEVMQHRDG